MDELRRGVLRLGRPDVLRQPFHQRQVVGQTAQQRHSRVRVQVDQTRNQQVPIKPLAPPRVKTMRSFVLWHDGNDATGVDHHRMVVEHDPGRIDRRQPARVDRQIDGVGGLIAHRQVSWAGKKNPAYAGFFCTDRDYLMPISSMSTRRSGCRHWITFLLFAPGH